MAAWVWVPWRTFRVRGIPTAYLDVFPGRLHVRAEPALRRLSGVPDFDYVWPVVVVERLLLLGIVPLPGGLGLLVDLGDALARVSVAFVRRRTLVNVLRQAGFEVVEVCHAGWEAPHAATRRELGVHVEQVPLALIAEN